MALGKDGRDLIHKYESVSQSGRPHLTSYYDDIGRRWTIGYGHTGDDVYEGQEITEEQADAYFEEDVRNKAEKFVDSYITIRISQKQRDALISFTYNAGGGSLQKSEIRQLINKNDHIEAVNAWKTQNTVVDGVAYQGLIRRRIEESALYGQGTTEEQIADAEGAELAEALEKKSIDDKVDIVPYTHLRGLGPMTISELINSVDFVTASLEKNELLELSYKSKTNHLRLWEALTITQKREYNGGDETYSDKIDYPIVNGTTIYMYAEKIAVDITYTSNITTQKVFDKKYWPNKIKTITNDPGYVPAYLATNEQQRLIHPQIQVLLWSRALYLQEGNQGGFVDITRHVNRVTMESSIDIGGNFSVHMNPVIGELVQQGSEMKWEMVGDLGPVALGNISKRVRAKSKVDEYQRTHNYYEKIVSQNDLIFISFEKLQLEGESILTIEQKLTKTWKDMIGLVDIPDVQGDAGSSTANTVIRGRDFSKALMDDNSYFNPYSIGHVNSLYGGKLGDRYLQGEFRTVAAFLAQSIRQKIEFIFHRIASIGYVPNDVFSLFENITKVTTLKRGVLSGVAAEDETKDANGIWQLCKVFVDPSLADLKLADDSVSNPQGSIYDLLGKVAQQPFVEFFTDTYENTFYLIFRQPPFTFKALEEAVKQYNPEDGTEFQEPVDVGSSTYTNPSGSEIEQSNDLWIDVDSEKYVEALQEIIVTGKGSFFPAVININAADVHSDDLKFSNEAYAWYQVEQKGNFAGNTVSLGHVPGIYFDEYAQVFGNRRLSVVSNYSNYKFFNHKKGEEDKDLYADQAAQELTFLIETSLYLPFTRLGTLVLNGDRRIRKGNWIYYRPTQEFFYVTSVSNQIGITSQSIDRTTTVQVERGMVKDFIKGKDVFVDGKEVKMGYFNLVDIDKLRDGIYDVVTKGSAVDKADYKSDIKLDSDVFNFFLKRRQFTQ